MEERKNQLKTIMEVYKRGINEENMYLYNSSMFARFVINYNSEKHYKLANWSMVELKLNYFHQEEKRRGRLVKYPGGFILLMNFSYSSSMLCEKLI